MKHIKRKLVTIVTEAVLESELCHLLPELGASGYTVTNARGSGSRGVRDAGWASSGNIRIEVICGDEVAARLQERLQRDYYSNYAMIQFESEVAVLRDDKFV